MEIAGQAAIVTGGASGLGAATARALAQAGAKVAIFDIDETRAAAMAAGIGGLAARCDVADERAARAALAEARARHGPARILVNCAGMCPPRRIVNRDGPMPLEEFERVIRVNLVGTFNMVRLAAADMLPLDPLEDQERGVCLLTASVAAFEGQIGQSHYAASKGGLVALNLVIAREFAQFGVRSVAIAPGIFHTPLLANLSQAAQESLGAAVPFPARLGDPEEYARLALHCIANRYLNGTTIRIDGALRMAPR